jgi:hypothetical protein
MGYCNFHTDIVFYAYCSQKLFIDSKEQIHYFIIYIFSNIVCHLRLLHFL